MCFRATCNTYVRLWFWTFLSCRNWQKIWVVYIQDSVLLVYLYYMICWVPWIHSLGRFLFCFAFCDKNNCNSFCIWKLWQHNVRITGKKLFSHILSKHFGNQTGFYDEVYFSNDFSLLAVLYRDFLQQQRGEYEIKEMGLSGENKMSLLILTFMLWEIAICIYFLLHFLCREQPQPDGWHDAICLFCFLPPRDVWLCLNIFKGSLCYTWIDICNYTLWKI